MAGIGMPRGMPARKRTGKPSRHVADLMSYYRAGKLESLDIGEQSVKLSHHGFTVVMSRTDWDRRMCEPRDVNILIRSNTPIWKLTDD